MIALKQVAGIAAGDVSAGQVGFRLDRALTPRGGWIRHQSRRAAYHRIQRSRRSASPKSWRSITVERRAIEAEVLQHALAQAEAAVAAGNRYSLVLAGEGWHPGVLGIVASRIVEKFYRPTVVIGVNDGAGKGSAAASAAFIWWKVSAAAPPSLEKFGGHEYRRAVSIKPEQLEDLSPKLRAAPRAKFSPLEQLSPLLEIDAALDFSAIGFAA